MIQQLALLTLGIQLWLGSTLNWQGMGNMTLNNMTVINNYISTNFSLAWKYGTVFKQDDTTLVDFATAFSNHLNSQWDPAWNVFVCYTYGSYSPDAVVYGYAFRDHWYWMNGIIMNDGKHASIILWKDYNCLTTNWRSYSDAARDRLFVTYDLSTSGFYPTTLLPVIDPVWKTNGKINVWEAAFNFGNAFTKDPKTSKYAFTIVASEEARTLFFGRFCAKDYKL